MKIKKSLFSIEFNKIVRFFKINTLNEAIHVNVPVERSLIIGIGATCGSLFYVWKFVKGDFIPLRFMEKDELNFVSMEKRPKGLRYR